ncbi:MAG: hypothetical protein ACFE88_13920 [Candidatus Hermodarchaeota archaeon]
MNPNIQNLLIEYKKLIDSDLLRAFIAKREGIILEDFKAGELDNNFNIFNETLSKIIERFPIGSF